MQPGGLFDAFVFLAAVALVALLWRSP